MNMNHSLFVCWPPKVMIALSENIQIHVTSSYCSIDNNNRKIVVVVVVDNVNQMKKNEMISFFSSFSSLFCLYISKLNIFKFIFKICCLEFSSKFTFATIFSISVCNLSLFATKNNLSRTCFAFLLAFCLSVFLFLLLLFLCQNHI